MTLLAPSRLWLLAAVVALAVAHLVLQRRRRHLAVRHPDVALVAAVAPRHAGWRRHLSAGALVLAVTALVVGLARPAYSAEVARDEAVIMLAIDVSGSMTATDVEPTRLAAAVAAATDFVNGAPEGFRIGLVAFDDTGHTLATPTTDRASVVAALARLSRGPGTAAGEGLFTALDELEAAQAADGAVVVADEPYSAVVLLADGANTIGRSLDAAAQAAADAAVPVFTIAYGTSQGTAVVDGTVVPVPADPEAMAAVADATGGATYEATTGAELSAVYEQIGTGIGYVLEQTELVIPLAAVALALLVLAAGTSMVWSPRLT
jgi:Ca-activated chloride channel family protein